MKAILKAAAIAAFVALAACEGQTDENLQDAAEQAVSDAGNGIEAAAEETLNAAGQAGDVLRNGVGELDNGVDVDVNLNADGNSADAER